MGVALLTVSAIWQSYLPALALREVKELGGLYTGDPVWKHAVRRCMKTEACTIVKSRSTGCYKRSMQPMSFRGLCSGSQTQRMASAQ